jgi:hypothetical protein
MNAHGFAKSIGDLAYDNGVYDEYLTDDIDVLKVSTFDESGLLTEDDGIVVRLRDGSEFHVTVVQSEFAETSGEEVAS